MVVLSPARFPVPLPAGHRFPAAKYAMVRDAVVARGLVPAAEVREPERAERWALRLVHADAWLDAMAEGTLDRDAERRLGFPWSAALQERALRTAQATLDAARGALATGAGLNLAGGTHHAGPDGGEGFCTYNDVALALRVLQREGLVRRAVVLDLDVHQGNGTARIFAADPDVVTFSMHAERNYPFPKPASTLDVGLADGTGDAAYLAALDRHLDEVLDRAAPDLAVYLAGADPYGGDRFGRLALSQAGLAARDARVFAALRRRGIPVTVTLAGGYAEHLEDLVAIHCTTVRLLRDSHG